MKKTVIFIMLVTLLLSACDTEEPGASASIEPTPTTAVPPTAEPTEEPAAEPTAVEVVEAESDVLQPYYEPLSPDECFATPPEDVEMAVEYDCGYIVVPEFYSGETTQSVKIPFIRFNSGQGTAVSPVLVHPGGPGQSQLNESFFSEFNIMFDEVIPDRDVIFMDPRGTDHAVPFLDCPAAYALDWQVFEQGLDDEAATALFRETFQQCIDDFKAQGVNLDAYNSLELAGDVNSVTQALGYEQIIYFGTSYGAQLGQHIMRDYPEILESIILNGSAPLSRQSWIEDRALDNQEALDNLVALCASEENAGCIEAYPDTPGQLDALLDNFADPISYTYTDPNDPSLTINVEVTESDIAGLIHGLMGNKNAITSLPWIIDSWSQPDQIDGLIEASGSQAAQAIITSRDLTKGDMAFLMHLAVVCSDDPVESADDIILNGVSDFAALAASPMAELYVNGCGGVNVRSLPDETDENVTVDIPTLLLSGGLDVSTPFVRSQLVADALPNATHVIFPGHTHDQLGGLSSCVEEVFTQFIADPEAELDTTCLATPDYLGFQLPDGSFTHDFEEEDAQVVPDDEQPMMAESTLSEEITAQLDAYLQSQVYTDGGSPRGAAPGLVLYVETPDGVYLNAAGVSNLEDGTPMQSTDILEIGSNTKSMTIVLLMQLVEEGLISLDDPLSQYLPDQAALLPNGDQITIRQMAQHTAGFYDYADSIIAAGLTDPAALEAEIAPAELVQAAVDQGTPYFAPGEEGQWHYSNTGYVLLGMIIESLTGETYGDLMQTRIFDPLGMESAVLLEGVPQEGQITTHGYWWQGDEILDTTNWNASQGWAAGAAAMTAEDLATYGKALAAGELFQNPETLNEMLTFDQDAIQGVGAPYGLGLFDVAGDGSVWGHAGQTLGFQSLWFTDPEKEIIVVGLTNSATYSADGLLNVRNILAGNGPLPVGSATLLPAADPTVWQWTQFVTPVEATEIDEPVNFQILLTGDQGVLYINPDCGSAFGTYTVEGPWQINIDLDTSGLTCDADSMGGQLAQHLNDAVSWYFDNGMLVIELPADGGTMVFTPPE